MPPRCWPRFSLLYGVGTTSRASARLDWILRQVAEVTLPEVVVPGFEAFAEAGSIAVSTVSGRWGSCSRRCRGL